MNNPGYAFVHLSFQEYFCACFLADRIVSPAFVKKGKSNDGLVNRDLLRQWGGESVWRETLVFLFELLSAERDADWMDDLADILFGSDANFGYYHAALAARALADRHVRLGREWQERLVNRCSVWVELDRPDNLVLPMLVEAGYAAIVEGPLEAIQHEARLRVLIANDSMITDVNPLVELSALQGINLSGTRVADVSPLAGLSALRWFQLNRTGVTDVSPLAGLSALERLDLDGTGVTDVSPLAGLSALWWLNLDGTGVTDVSPLAGLSALRWLNLKGTGVTDVSPLAGLSALWWLNLDGTGVTDVSPLAGLPNLEVLIGGKRIRPAELHGDDLEGWQRLSQQKSFGE